MPPVPLPGFVGGSYTSRSLNFDSERTINLYPEMGERPATPKTRGQLLGTPGLEPFVQLGSGPVRALFYQDDRCFAVGGNHFYEVFASQTATDRGEIGTDALPSTISSNGTAGHQLFITSDGAGYIYDLDADTLTLITDAQFLRPSLMGAFMDGYFLSLTRYTSTFQVSDLEDGLSWSGTAVAQANKSSDDKVAMIVASGNLWLFGTKITEVWYDSGTGDPPFQPYQGAPIQMGIAAQWSAVALDNTVFWIGQNSDGTAVVFRANGFTPERISTHAIETYLNRLPRISDTIGWTYQEEGHAFYCLYIPIADTQLVYDVNEGIWIERAIWDANKYLKWFPDLPRCHAYAFGHHLVGDRQSGTIYTQSLELHTCQFVRAGGL